MRGFRAWHTKLNRYLKDDEFYVDSDGSVWALFETDDDGILETRYTGRCTRKDFDNGYVIREDSTGLKDKNGKEIYEGDILGGIWESGFISWCEECKQFQYHCAGIGCMACSGDVHWCEIVEDDGKLEVIGNIHENPELLEEGK